MMRFSPLYMWADYKIDEYILSELKIKPVINKIHNYIDKQIQHVRGMYRDRQTDCHT